MIKRVPCQPISTVRLYPMPNSVAETRALMVQYGIPEAHAAKWSPLGFGVRAESDDDGDMPSGGVRSGPGDSLVIDGVIDDTGMEKMLGDAGVTPLQVRSWLEDREGEDRVVWINSPGGSFFAGEQIRTWFLAHTGKITMRVAGFCASAATVVMLGGDEREMSQGSTVMIHRAWMGCRGNCVDLRAFAARIEKTDIAMSEAYAAVMNYDSAEILGYMDEETEWSAAECVDNGFANRIFDGSAAGDPEGDNVRAAVVAERQAAAEAHGAWTSFRATQAAFGLR